MERNTKFCSNCGAEIDVRAEICPKCGVRVAQISTPIPLSVQKNSGISAVLSFIWPGLGQVYNGQIGKGIAIMLIQFVLLVFSVFIVTLIITLPAMFAIWAWNIYDAYSIAEKINRGEKV